MPRVGQLVLAAATITEQRDGQARMGGYQNFKALNFRPSVKRRGSARHKAQGNDGSFTALRTSQCRDHEESLKLVLVMAMCEGNEHILLPLQRLPSQADSLSDKRRGDWSEKEADNQL